MMQVRRIYVVSTYLSFSMLHAMCIMHLSFSKTGINFPLTFMLPPVSLSAPDNVLKLIENVFFKVLARQKHPQSISNPTSWHHTECLQNNFTLA